MASEQPGDGVGRGGDLLPAHPAAAALTSRNVRGEHVATAALEMPPRESKAGF
jgi:hypothetical protein